MSYTMIRCGRVLDIAAGTAELADILIEDDTIREIGPPGIAAPEGAAVVSAERRANPSRPGQCPHPCPRQSRQGDGRPLDLGAAADRGAVADRQPRPRRYPSDRPARCGRDGAEGLHRLLRPLCRISAADPRRPGSCRRGLSGSRHARGDRADDRRPHFLRGDPRPPDALPDALRERVAALRLAPGEATLRRSAPRSRIGRPTATGCGSPWRRRSRIIARTISSSAAPRWPATSMVGLHVCIEIIAAASRVRQESDALRNCRSQL